MIVQTIKRQSFQWPHNSSIITTVFSDHTIVVQWEHRINIELKARLQELATPRWKIVRSSPTKVVAVAFDWVQSPLFFSKFSEGIERERAENEALPSRAFSHVHGHLRVLRVSLDGLRKRETARSLRSLTRGFQLQYKVLTETFLVSWIGVISLMELRWSLTKGGHTWRFPCSFWDDPTLAELWVKATWHSTGHIYLSDFFKTLPLGFRLAPGAAGLQASPVSKKVGGLPSWSVQLSSPGTALTEGVWITQLTALMTRIKSNGLSPWSSSSYYG